MRRIRSLQPQRLFMRREQRAPRQWQRVQVALLQSARKTTWALWSKPGISFLKITAESSLTWVQMDPARLTLSPLVPSEAPKVRWSLNPEPQLWARQRQLDSTALDEPSLRLTQRKCSKTVLSSTSAP